MREQSENTAKMFKEFAYAVSHDLGAPLRAMVEFSRLLKEEHPHHMTKDEALYLSMIIENGEKAQDMLAGLLEYSRLNTVAHPLTMVDCNALFVQCRQELQDKIVLKRAEILCETDLPMLQADEDRLKRLFMILLDNALTFHTPGSKPKIALFAKRRNDGWMLGVRDNGIGIDKRFHERIFEPFRRLHTFGEYPGIGMGLALAKKIMHYHGGYIWLDSAPGQGSAFICIFPEKKVA